MRQSDGGFDTSSVGIGVLNLTSVPCCDALSTPVVMRKSDVAEYHFHAFELGSLLAERNAATTVSIVKLRSGPCSMPSRQLLGSSSSSCSAALLLLLGLHNQLTLRSLLVNSSTERG